MLFSTTEGCPPATLNWENDEARWVLPDEVAGFDAVPSLVRVKAGRMQCSDSQTDPCSLMCCSLLRCLLG